MAESFIDEEVTAQTRRNLKLVETIESHGGDLHLERQIDFFFYTNTPSDAAALSEDLRAAGFVATHIGDEPFDGKWSVQGVMAASVAEVTQTKFVEQLVSLAAKYLAEFDGWGTAI